LASAALGLKSAPGTPWLLLLIPFASAYVDLNCYQCYQYLIRITVLARCLRERSEDRLLLAYEELCEELRREHGVFNLGQYAQIGVSLATSVAPSFAMYQFIKARNWVAVPVFALLWAFGLSLILHLWRYFKIKNSLSGSGAVRSTGGQAQTRKTLDRV
jgi:hypothetical protein